MGQQESTSVQRYQGYSRNSDDNVQFTIHNPEVHVYNGQESTNQFGQTGPRTTIYSSATQARQVRQLERENRDMEEENLRILKEKERKEADLLRKEAELSMYKRLAKQAVEKEMLAKNETKLKLQEKDKLIRLQKQKLEENKAIIEIALENVVEQAVTKTLEKNQVKAFNHQYKFNPQSSSDIKSKFESMKIDNKLETKPANQNVGQRLNDKKSTKNEFNNQGAKHTGNATQFRTAKNPMQDNMKCGRGDGNSSIFRQRFNDQEPTFNHTSTHSGKPNYQNIQNKGNAMFDGNMRMRNNTPFIQNPQNLNYPQFGQQHANAGNFLAPNFISNMPFNQQSSGMTNIPPIPQQLQNLNYPPFGQQQAFTGNCQSSNFSGPPTNFSGPPKNFSGPPKNFSGPPKKFSGPPTNFSGPPTNFSGSPTNFYHSNLPFNQQSSGNFFTSRQNSNSRPNQKFNTKNYQNRFNNASNSNDGKMNRKTTGNDKKKEQNHGKDSVADNATNFNGSRRRCDPQAIEEQTQLTSNSSIDFTAQSSDAVEKNPGEEINGKFRNTTKNDTKNERKNDDVEDAVADNGHNGLKSSRRRRRYGRKTKNAQTHLGSDNDAAEQKPYTNKNPRKKITGQNDDKKRETSASKNSLADDVKTELTEFRSDKTDMNLISDDVSAEENDIVNEKPAEKMRGQFQCPICSKRWVGVYHDVNQKCLRCKIDVAPIKLMPKKKRHGGEKHSTEMWVQSSKEDIDTVSD